MAEKCFMNKMIVNRKRYSINYKISKKKSLPEMNELYENRLEIIG